MISNHGHIGSELLPQMVACARVSIGGGITPLQTNKTHAIKRYFHGNYEIMHVFMGPFAYFVHKFRTYLLYSQLYFRYPTNSYNFHIFYFETSNMTLYLLHHIGQWNIDYPKIQIVERTSMCINYWYQPTLSVTNTHNQCNRNLNCLNFKGSTNVLS